MAKKYFLDQEFIEGWRKPIWWLPSIGWFNKMYFTIELISIGIYSEDGREYFAVNKNFNERYASKWVKENVITKLPPRYIGDSKMVEDIDPLHGQSNVFIGPEPNSVYKTLKQIKYDIVEFLCPYEIASEYADVGSLQSGLEGFLLSNPVEFYGYFADYDWVLFCSIFGTMMDLPKGMPRYCIDLKQILDEDINNRCKLSGEKFKDVLKSYKNKYGYPVNNNEHDAISDAKWNYHLYNFLYNLF